MAAIRNARQGAQRAQPQGTPMVPPNAHNGVSSNMAGHGNGVSPNMAGHGNGDAAGNMTPPAGRAGRDGNFTMPRSPR